MANLSSVLFNKFIVFVTSEVLEISYILLNAVVQLLALSISKILTGRKMDLQTFNNSPAKLCGIWSDTLPMRP